MRSSVTKPRYNWGPVSHASVGNVVRIDANGDVEINFPEHSSWTGRLGELEIVHGSDAASAHDDTKPEVIDVDSTLVVGHIARDVAKVGVSELSELFDVDSADAADELSAAVARTEAAHVAAKAKADKTLSLIHI